MGIRSRTLGWMGGAAFAVASPAFAAPDGHGDAPLPESGRVFDPTWSWTAPDHGAIGLIGEAADAPMVRWLTEGGQTTSDGLVGDVFGANLSAAWAPKPRFAVAFVAPIFAHATVLGAGVPATVGDVHLWAPVSLVRSDAVHVDVLPSIGLPTGASADYLGAGALTGEVSLAASLRSGPIGVWGRLGGRAEPDSVDGRDVARAIGAFAVGWSRSDALALFVEARFAATLAAPELWRQVPSEAMLSARGAVGQRVRWSVGAGTAVTSGIGAAAFRGYAGAGIRIGPVPKPIVPVIGPDGTPLPPLSKIAARDALGRPVRGAAVTVDGVARGTTDATGTLILDPAVAPGVPVTVTRDGYVASAIAGDAARPEGAGAVTLGWSPVPLRLRATGPDGRVLDAAEIAFEGLDPQPEGVVDSVGTHAFLLPQGTFTLVVRAPGFGAQTRTVVIAPGRTEPIAIDAVLTPASADGAPLALTLTSPNGLPVEGAFVEVDGVAVGTTASGGSLTVDALPKGAHVVEIAQDAHASVRLDGVSGARSVEVPWKPGTVIVVARTADATVTDALVAFDGPTRLPPVPLGPDGQRPFQLRAGEWTALVSSIALGSQQRRFAVREEGGITALEVVLAADEGGTADAVVEVVDADGASVDDATVAVDGAAVGRTTNLGTLALLGLDPGVRHIEITAEDGRKPAVRDVELLPGRNRVPFMVGYAPGTVEVDVTGPDGQPIDALVAWRGATATPPEHTGSDGRSRIQLAPGAWAALISNVDYGSQTRTIVVPADSDALQRVDAELRPPDPDNATLDVRVVDPNGDAIAGADVTIDGDTYGHTGNGGDLEVGALGAGRHRIAASAEAFGGGEASVQVRSNGTIAAVLHLPWGPGAARVAVTGEDGSIPEGVTVAASGPRVLAPVKLDASNVRRLALAPGDWWLLANAVGYAPVQKRVTISGDAGLTEISIALASADPDLAELVLHVATADDAPVGGAEVRVGGVVAGITSPGGDVVLERPPGPAHVEIAPSAGLLGASLNLDLASGPAERMITIDWRRFPVAFAVTDASGAPVDVQILLQGPDAEPIVRSGADGTEEIALRAGAWQAFATRPGVGVAQVGFKVVPAVDPLPVVMRVGGPRSGVSVSGTQVAIEEQIRFDLDQATLRPDAAPILDEIARVLLANPDLGTIEIQGHTDDTGTVAHNLDLSQRRAETVRDALIARGVAPERLVARGYGMLRPLFDGGDEASRSANRRVQFVIVAAE